MKRASRLPEAFFSLPELLSLEGTYLVGQDGFLHEPAKPESGPTRTRQPPLSKAESKREFRQRAGHSNSKVKLVIDPFLFADHVVLLSKRDQAVKELPDVVACHRTQKQMPAGSAATEHVTKTMICLLLSSMVMTGRHPARYPSMPQAFMV